MKREPITVAYVRVSSRAQDYKTQAAAIEQAARARKDKIALWYEEKASASKTTDRPALNKLREAARAGLITKLYVFRLDRLARSGIRAMFEVLEDFKRHGVEVVTLADGFDVNGPAAEIVLAVLAWAAQMETLAMRERVSAARERVEAAGGRWGRPSRVDDACMERLRLRREAGWTIRQIAAYESLTPSVVGRALFRWLPPAKRVPKTIAKRGPKTTGKAKGGARARALS